MTASHDLERRIADFYATEPHLRAPDRVLEQALTTIESTPQRRVLVRAPWRFPPMRTFSKVAVATVAIVAVTFAVTRILPWNGVGDPPTPAPTATSLPSPMPTAAPTLAAALQLPGGDRLLELARYYVDIPGSDVRVEFAVSSESWRGNGWYLKSPSHSVSFWSVANVYPDACEQSLDRLPDPPIGPTVQDFVAALDAQRHTDLQVIGTTTVGGYESTRVILEPASVLAQECHNSLDMQLWVGPDGMTGRSISTTESIGGLQDVLWVVDAGGSRVVIVAYFESSTDEGDAVREIIDSIEFVLP